MAPDRKPRNLNDLARQAKVTATTVSMALRDSPRLSAALKEKIRQMAAESDFTPRAYNRKPKPRAERKYAHLGPVMLLDQDYGDRDPVHDGIFPAVSQKLSQSGVTFQEFKQSEIRKNPEILQQFAAVLFYNDLHGIELPEGFPAVQVFGWNPTGAAVDRITADDRQVVSIAVDYFRRAGAARAAIVWNRHMVEIPDHPRISGFVGQMAATGIEATLMPFVPEEPDFTGRLREYVEQGDDRIGFFGFNALCGVRLCCALESLGLMRKYGKSNVLICDKSLLLDGFYPHPAMIDLNLPVMAERAAEMLLRRLAEPGIPALLALQSPRLVGYGE